MKEEIMQSLVALAPTELKYKKDKQANKQIVSALYVYIVIDL